MNVMCVVVLDSVIFNVNIYSGARKSGRNPHYAGGRCRRAQIYGVYMRSNRD